MTKQPGTLSQLLNDLVEQHGDETALIYEEETLTFAMLEDRASRLAGGLAELGVKPGDKVAAWLPNTFAWVELEFALARLGAVAVSINTMFRSREAQDILSRSGARMLVLWPSFKDIDFLSMVSELDAERIPDLKTLILLESDQLTLGETSLSGMRRVAYEDLLTHERMEEDSGSPEAPCVVITSSGSTGPPKLVMHTQHGLLWHSRTLAQAFSYTDADCVVLGMLPFCGVFGLNTVMGAVAAGRPTILMSAFDADNAVRLIETHGATHTTASDDMLRRILSAADGSPERISSLREAGFGSFSADPSPLVADGDRLGKKFYTGYGSSEAQTFMALQPPDSDVQRRALKGGVPISEEMDVRVRDQETGELLPQEQSGELEIHGPHVTPGYLNNPQAAKENFTDDGYLRSGDLGYLTSDGIVYIARIGDVLRISGFLVSPQEIENYLESLPGIEDAQVVGISTGQGTRAVAFVIMEEAHDLDEAGVIDRCREAMAKFKVPERVIAVEEFPTAESPNGRRVQRNKLRELAKERLKGEEAIK